MYFYRYCGRTCFEPIKTRHLSTVRNLNGKNFVSFLEQLCLLQTSMFKECKYEGEYLINIFFRILLTSVNRSLCWQFRNLVSFVLEWFLDRSISFIYKAHS